jgi:uncharacterized protein YcbK (DUF882 family)
MRLGPVTTAGILVCAILLTAAQADAKGKARGAKKRRAKVFSGHGVDRTVLRKAPVPKASGDIWVYSVNFREEVRVNIYRKDGPAQASAAMTAVGQARAASDQDASAQSDPGRELDEEALAQLDQVFRCKRTGEVRAVNPRLYETLSVISDHFGGKRIDLISGFRFQREEGSRHFHGSAMDIRIPGVSIRELRKFAESLDTGGMGIGLYPRANFVHVDWRAPGEPSFRWVDRSSTRKTGGKRPSRRWHGKKPNS